MLEDQFFFATKAQTSTKKILCVPLRLRAFVAKKILKSAKSHSQSTFILEYSPIYLSFAVLNFEL